MIKSNLVFIFLLSITTVHSQFYFENFRDIESIICPITNGTYQSVINWEVYQTVGDSIDGERIENCFNFSDQQKLIVDTAIDESPIFLSSIEDLNAELASDFPYTLSFGFRSTENDLCDCTFDCELPACFSVNLKLSAITGNDTVRYEKLIKDPIIESDGINFINCIVTDAADKTILNGIDITISKESYADDEELRIFSISLFEYEGVDFENRIIPDDFKINSAYFVSPVFFNPYQFGGTIIRHMGPGIPSQQNIFYHDLVPEESNEQQIINMILTPEEDLLFQNFTGLRGAIVDGDPNQTRHTFNLINEGSTICFPEIVEVIFSNEDSFIHKSGTLDFQTRDGCMQFRDKSKFIVENNSHLKYGKNGKGLCALRNQSQIVLKKDSELIFDGELILKESENNNLNMILNSGSEFTFEPRSKITSKLNHSEIQLTVYVNGGTINTSNLDSESLKYLNIVDYLDPKINSEYFVFEMFPNPTSNEVTLVNSTIENVKFNIYSQEGKLVLVENVNALARKNIDLKNTEPGIYFVKSSVGTQRKLVINR